MSGGEFLFNDEFFLDSNDVDRLRYRYPLTSFALYSQHISDQFRAIDEDAMAMKGWLQRCGMATIGLALAALVFATIEPSLLAPLAESGAIDLALLKASVVCSAALGLASVIIGLFGFGISGVKSKWVEARMIGEHIRQWRWRRFCAQTERILEIAEGGDSDAMQSYVAEMEADFDAFLYDLRRNAAFQLDRICDGRIGSDDAFDAADRSGFGALARAQSPAAEELKRAFLEIRIGAQERYSEYLVTGRGRFKTHPRTQLSVVHGLEHWALVGVFVLHLLVILGVWTGSSVLASAEVHALAVIFALCALAVHSLQDGLRPIESLARMRAYLSEVRSVRRRFAAARSSRQFEEAAAAIDDAQFREMQAFLVTGRSARFVF